MTLKNRRPVVDVAAKPPLLGVEGFQHVLLTLRSEVGLTVLVPRSTTIVARFICALREMSCGALKISRSLRLGSLLLGAAETSSLSQVGYRSHVTRGPVRNASLISYRQDTA